MIQAIHNKIATPGPGYAASSSTSATIASTGTITLTTQAGLAYTPGARVRVSYSSDTTKWMEGRVSSYAGTTIAFLADKSNGSGTFTSWNINASGEPGAATTVAVGTTTTGAAGSAASVGNSGTTFAAVFDFAIPQGAQGPAGSAVNPRGAYASGTTYAQFDGVTDAGIAYISLQAANTGHTPASSPTWWQSVGSSGVSDPGANGVMTRTASNTTAPAKADDISAPVYAIASGTNTLTATLSPAITAYVSGVRYRFKAAADCTGATTLNLCSLGAVTIRKWSGGSLVDLGAGDIRSGQMIDVTYDGSYMQLGGGSGSAQTPWGQDVDAAGFKLTHVAKVGVGGVTSPNTSIDTDGAVSFRRGADIALANGVNNDIDIGSQSFRRCGGPTGAFSITGFNGGFSGRLFFLWNAAPQTLTLKHYNTGSSAVNRLFNPSGTDVTLRASANSFAGFIYDDSLAAWVLMFSN